MGFESATEWYEPGSIVRLEALSGERWRWWPEGPFVMRTADRVCLAVYIDGRLAEVQGPVRQ